jgi:hypothetical protein
VVRVVVLNATFNNISVISWWSVLLIDKTGIFQRSKTYTNGQFTQLKIKDNKTPI